MGYLTNLIPEANHEVGQFLCTAVLSSQFLSSGRVGLKTTRICHSAGLVVGGNGSGAAITTWNKKKTTKLCIEPKAFFLAFNGHQILFLSVDGNIMGHASKGCVRPGWHRPRGVFVLCPLPRPDFVVVRPGLYIYM